MSKKKSAAKAPLMNMTRWIVLVSVILVVSVVTYAKISADNRPGEHDALAQCLTDNGVTMYGASWCPHCAAQKEAFGNSFRLVDYVECALPNGGQTQACNEAGIQSYPTWEFGDGTREVGELTLEELAEKSSCPVS
jgi:glutaredoxin